MHTIAQHCQQLDHTDHLRKYKVSAYNLIERDEDGYLLVGNTFTSAVVRLPPSTNQKILEILVTPNRELQLFSDDPTTMLFLANGFLVADEFNELEVIRNRWERGRVGAKALGLAIIPTMSCNFRCTYCYESHENVDMSTSIQERVLTYVEKNLAGRELLDVVWFGGEPLIRPRILKRLSDSFTRLARKHDIEYRASAVTNGYLLSKSKVEFLKSILVKNLQVTLDGSQADHDHRRVLVNGGPTYSRILNNLLLCAQDFESIILRVNIDTRNQTNLDALLSDLLPIKSHITVAFRPTHPPESDVSGESWCMAPSDWWPLHKKLLQAATELGFSIAQGYPVPGTPFCSAYQLNSISVDPYGDIHTCPVFIGKRQLRFGTLTADGEIMLLDSLQRDWAEFNPFEDKSCATCNVLPICMGGCPNQSGRGESSYRCFARNTTIAGLSSDYFLNRARAAT